jgi:hypothetical protein
VVRSVLDIRSRQKTSLKQIGLFITQPKAPEEAASAFWKTAGHLEAEIGPCCTEFRRDRDGLNLCLNKKS